MHTDIKIRVYLCTSVVKNPYLLNLSTLVCEDTDLGIRLNDCA